MAYSDVLPVMNNRLRLLPPNARLDTISGMRIIPIRVPSVRGKHVHAVITVADPTHARPDIAVLVATDAVGKTDLAVHFHAGERLAVLELLAVHIVDPDYAFRA